MTTNVGFKHGDYLKKHSISYEYYKIYYYS